MSAPAHTVLSVQQFLTKNGTTPMLHPPYSPHIIPSDFFLFLQMKNSSKGNILEEVKQKIAEALKDTKIDKFNNRFEQRKKCLDRCSTSNGEYSEGNSSLNM